MKQLFALTIALLIFGCQGVTEEKFNLVQVENGLEYNEKLTLSSKGVLRLKLDEQTGFYQRSVDFKEIEGRQVYSFINRLNNSVYLYDLATEELMTSIYLPVEGPQGVGSLQVAAHVLDNEGNIIIYNINSGFLFKLNQKGEILKKIALFDIKGEDEASYPNPSSTRRMVLVDNAVYIPCEILKRRTSYKNTTSLLKVDLNTGDANYQLEYPEVYDLGYWGAVFKYQPSLAYNPTKEEFVVSFPADPTLHTIDESGEKLEQTYVGSKFIEKFEPLTTDMGYGVKKNPNKRDKRSYQYSLTTSEYSSLLYDQYNKLYYRFVANRPGVERFEQGDKKPEYSIIITDSELTKLGEIRLDKDKYQVSMAILTQEGLAIPRLDQYEKSEDELEFEIFKPIMKNDALANK